MRRWGGGQADAFIRRFDEAFDRLRAFPLSGRDAGDLRPGYRMVAVSDYLIFYRLMGSDIEIIRVLHGHMDVRHHLDPDS